ncbi:MAG: CRISPR-associated ring nuclease [Rhodoferax sp.]|nr:CRISPR-associated ring nuclease [Rhodoferax sp.]
MNIDNPKPKNILLCTLGASWAVIPEILGWLAPQVLDLYAHHPQRSQLDLLRTQHQLKAPDELWVCTTQGSQTQASLSSLHAWWQLLGQPMPLRIWAAAGTDQLASQAECEHMRELILRTTLLASEHTRHGGQLVLSLAGGRKTMSADLQSAGALFGAKAWLHVVSPEPSPPPLFARSAEEKAEQPRLLAQALEANLAASLTPLIAGVGQRNELLDIAIDGQRIDSTGYALPLAAPNQVQAWALPAPGDALHRELMQRQTQSSQLMGNFLAQLAQTEHHDNWRSLYRLAPAHIDTLRHTTLTSAHLPWLTALPKADLHRHLGGCLDITAQREVARCIWTSLGKEIRLQRMQHLRELLSKQEWPWDWPQTLAGKHRAEIRAELCAGLLLHASIAQFQHNLYAVTEPRLALKTRHPHGFSAFERPGELSGSALLAHPAALTAYAQAIVAQARAEGLAYLELRGSPHKYRQHNPADFVRDLRQALLDAGAQVSATAHSTADPTQPRIGFIWILDRRQPKTLTKTVQQALIAKGLAGDFMLGLDLAGDEGSSPPEQLAAHFTPAFANCLPLTIHAGEGEAAHNIWQAAYHLHADRIGHGLTLADNAALAGRFRDRGICLELCPSSNREVVGFADPAYPESAGLAPYPLRQFMQLGLPVTLCTDNPAISRTTLAGEFLAAARMTNGGLSLWECLALMRQAFVHAFLPSAEREALLKRVDTQIFELIAHPGAENAHHKPTP